MLRDRYDPVDIFARVPQLSQQIDPVLAQLDTLLDDDTLFQQVKADLSQRYPLTLVTGRRSTPVEVILRMLVIKHLYGWSYEQTEHWVADSLVLRDFCRLYWQPVPDDTTLIRWANLIQPLTLHTLLDHVVALAQNLKATRGRKLRTDGTVVETNIHAPADSGLLNDGVRVLSRLLGAARDCLGETTQQAGTLFRDRTRSARRLAKQIIDTVRSRGEQAADQRKAIYGRLIGVGEAMVSQAQAVGALLKKQGQAAAQKLAAQLEQFSTRLQTVVRQTQRRVLHGEQVPASAKLVSLFEPETAIIRKGKLSKATEYGRVIWLDEVEGGIISRYEVLDGNPADSDQMPLSLEHHREVFKHPPKLFTADRGCWSAANETAAEAAGVEQICLPKPGAKTAERVAHEQQGWFVRGRNWRAGIEGRIAALKRRYKLDRCLYHGTAGMERWVGWGILSHDLWRIAQATAKTA
jgi:transposase, IS5 family